MAEEAAAGADAPEAAVHGLASLRAVVMGVSGSGKSTVGEGLARRLGLPFVDADDLHPASNVGKMRQGIALTDEDRWPWLDLVSARLAESPCVMACSALRRRYRDRLRRACPGAVFVHLTGGEALIAGRQASRVGHFMPPSLLDSQFSTLEPPAADEAAISVDVSAPADAVVEAAVRSLRRLAAGGVPTGGTGNRKGAAVGEN